VAPAKPAPGGAACGEARSGGGSLTAARARELRLTMPGGQAVVAARANYGRLDFRRQSPVGRYIADFECRRRRLIVEADQHGLDINRMQDEICDRTLSDRGYRVLRFGNEDIEKNIEGVLDVIHQALVSDQQTPPDLA